MFQILLLSATINTSNACDPAPIMPRTFYPIDGSTNIPVDSHIILKASGSSEGGGGGVFSFTLTAENTDIEVAGEFNTVANAGDHWDHTRYYIFVPDEPLLPDTTYTLLNTSEAYSYLESSTFTTGTENAIVSTQTPEIEITAQNHVPEDDFCGVDAHFTYTIEVSNVVLSEDQNTHLYLNQVDAEGNLLAVERMKSVNENPASLTANTNTNEACFTVSHYHQNGELIGESGILCADAIEVEDTEGSDFVDEGESDAKGCSSTKQGTFTWMGLIGLIGLSMSRRRR